MLPDATISGGSLSSVGTGNPGELIGPSLLPLRGSNEDNFSKNINIGKGSPLELSFKNIQVAEIDLADGSKIINGTIVLDQMQFLDDLSNLLFSEDIEAVLNGMSISENENRIYDLNNATIVLPILNFKNGGKIVRGTISITSDHPDYPIINEMLVNDSIKVPALLPTTELKSPVLNFKNDGKVPEGTVSIPAKDLNGTAVSSDKLIINHLQ